MAKKTVFAKIDERVKKKAEIIMSRIDVTPDEAINMFYRIIIMKNDLPFKIKPREEVRARAETAEDNFLQKSEEQ